VADIPRSDPYGPFADRYELGRPGYPRESVDHLVRALGLDTSSAVVEVGAGTGKLTRDLVDRVGTIIAVEPSEGMRRMLVRQVAVDVMAGTAEDLPIPDASVDAVLAAQTWHWVDGERAAAEAHRVLRSGGLGLVWNRWDVDEPLMADLRALVDSHRHGSPTYGTGEWRTALERSPLFGPIETASFPNRHTAERDAVIARVMSESVIASLDDDERSRVAVRIEDVLGDRERVEMAYICDVHVLEKR
jgi:SAM-dependent methyltransferase